MLNNDIKVTIVTVCYNAVDVIENTILSVVNQAYPNIEYVIIDGGSTDGTVEVIRKYVDRISKWVSEPDKGIYDAMNKAIDMATGDWINYMNAGDCFASNMVVEDMMTGVDSGCDVIFGNTILVRGNHKVVSKGEMLENDFPKLVHQSSFVNTTLLKKCHFDRKYMISADYAFLYALYKEGRHFCYKDINVAQYDMTGFSATHRALLYREHCAIQGKKTVWYKLLKYQIEDSLPQQFANWLIRVSKK